jgi:hypothetical protein
MADDENYKKREQLDFFNDKEFHAKKDRNVCFFIFLFHVYRKHKTQFGNRGISFGLCSIFSVCVNHDNE